MIVGASVVAGAAATGAGTLGGVGGALLGSKVGIAGAGSAMAGTVPGLAAGALIASLGVAVVGVVE